MNKNKFTKMKRLIYFGYYIKSTSWKRYLTYLSYVNRQFRIPKRKIFLDTLYSSIKYNISFEEYFIFRFWEKDSSKRKEWAGAGFMYEFHLSMTPKGLRETLKNKAKFLKHNQNFIMHRWINAENGDFTSMRKFLKDIEGKVVIKQVDGNCGRGVKVFDTKKTSVENIIEFAKKYNYTLAEEFIVQHSALMQLSPAGLNTVRIVTQINKNGGVDILAARIRITINSFVDNFHAGNMAAAVDVDTGKIILPAVYGDITKPVEEIHPITGVKIVGFQIPRWTEVIEKTKAIALHNKENRSVGWDIAITDDGVDYIEGNHDWNQDIFQIPINKGMKNILETYLH